MKTLGINSDDSRTSVFSYPVINILNTVFEPYELVQIDTEHSLHLFINKKIDEVKTIVVVGAWRGDEIMTFLQYTNAKVFCFEPNPENFTYLSERFKNYPNVTCFPYACGNVDGEMELHEGNVTGNDSLLPIVNSERLYLKKKHKVKVVKLDNIKELQGRTIDLLWMDVQGYELDVLQGSTNLLNNVLAIFSEVYEQNSDYSQATTYKKITDHLSNKNFNLVAEGVSKLETGKLGGNALYINKSIPLDTGIFELFQERITPKLNNEKFKRGLFSNGFTRLILSFIPVSLKIKIKDLLKI